MKSVPQLARFGWLIVAAWSPELAHLRRRLRTLQEARRRNVTLRTVGVGLVEAAAGCAHAIAEHAPRGILLVGTAGLYASSATPPLAIGTATIVRRTRLLSAVHGDNSSYLPSVLPQEQRCSPPLVKALEEATALPSVDVACPLAITASANAARAAAKASACAVENLEAFAVARAAARTRTPFAAVLGIANHVGPSAHAQWKTNAQAAARAACEAVFQFLRDRAG